MNIIYLRTCNNLRLSYLIMGIQVTEVKLKRKKSKSDKNCDALCKDLEQLRIIRFYIISLNKQYYVRVNQTRKNIVI